MRSIRRLLHHQTFKNRRGEKQETRTWYITINGKHYPLGEDVIEAEARAKEMLSRTARRQVMTDPTFDDLLQLVEDDYTANHRPSRDHVKSRAAHLRGFFGNPKASQIQAGTIRAYQAHRQAEGAAPATINVETALLQRGFSLARQDGMLVDAGPTFPRLAENNARKGFFERAEMEAVVQFCPEYLQGLIRAAYFTGWRKQELVTREWRHVDDQWLRLDPGTTKNGEGREFPLIPELREILKDQREYVDALQVKFGRLIPWVFPDENGHPITHFWFDWDRARRLAHLEHRLFHDFRRTAVRNMEQAGVPRSSAMALVGHKTQAMYTRYAIADRQSLTSAGEKLTSLHSGPQSLELKTLHFQKKTP